MADKDPKKEAVLMFAQYRTALLPLHIGNSDQLIDDVTKKIIEITVEGHIVDLPIGLTKSEFQEEIQYWDQVLDYSKQL